ncbi:MAG: SusC/RagA family TonB-linked outer membrane protein [Sphingobacteriaceae bacterium]|nr:SusC/RagA family TonB-linked outer membrane protein [Sphingobacteriaceae bacterium]
MKKVYFMKLGLLGLFLFATLLATAQTGSISGRVLDESKKPLPGASVSIKGTSKSTSTDANGTFKISGVNNGAATVVASFVGYNTLEKNLTVNGDVRVDFSLQPSAESLNEVVVIGYGTQKKSDLTGSITSVSAKDFVKGQVTTPEQLIAGKVAGVQITSNGGAPGSGSTIRIRGGASLSASNNPLIVIDNVPLAESGVAGAANGLALINPNDIESFNILKDASATAIYGSRASNGVILITTKKGSSGKPTFSFNTQTSVSENVNTVDVLSARQLRDVVNTYGTAAQKALLGSANTNWQEEIYNTALSTDNNLGVAGSYKNIPYRISYGYMNQQGTLKTGKLQRNSLGLNLSPTFFNDLLKVNLNVKGSINKSRFADQGAIGSAVYFDPTKPVFTTPPNYVGAFGGYYEWLDPTNATTGLAALAPKNPLALLDLKQDNGTAKRSIGNLELDLKMPFLTDLRAHANIGYDIADGSGTVVIPEYAASSFKRFSNKSGVNNKYKQTRTDLLMEYYLAYNKELPSIDSKLDVVAGWSYQQFKTKNYNYTDNTFDGTVVNTPNFAFDIPENRMLSMYGRINYAFKGRYLLTASVRRDGSSRFSEENRFAIFPSAAFAWKVSDESFLKNSKVISDLKLRLGYGVTGQQEGIGNYDYLSYYNYSSNQSMYQFGNTFYNMYAPGGYYGARKWEQTETYNLGLDFGVLANRISGSVDVYLKKTSDLLNNITQSAGANFSNQVVANVGNMENKGVELNLNGQVIRNSNFTWDLGLNATLNKNTITKLTIAPDPNYPGNTFGGISGGTGNTIMINSVGYNRGSFYVLQQVYNAAGKPIEGLFVDRNGDGTINNKDLYQYKSADPKAFLGLTSNFTYKKWNAGFIMRASIGNYMYNNQYSSNGRYNAISSLPTYLGNASINYLDTKFDGITGGVNQLLSDYYVQNASFLRLDNLNIGYNVGNLLAGKASMRINASVQNVFTITKYKGLDPEIGGGIDNNFYPRPRIVALGLNLDF